MTACTDSIEIRRCFCVFRRFGSFSRCFFIVLCCRMVLVLFFVRVRTLNTCINQRFRIFRTGQSKQFGCSHHHIITTTASEQYLPVLYLPTQARACTYPLPGTIAPRAPNPVYSIQENRWRCCTARTHTHTHHTPMTHWQSVHTTHHTPQYQRESHILFLASRIFGLCLFTVFVRFDVAHFSELLCCRHPECYPTASHKRHDTTIIIRSETQHN